MVTMIMFNRNTELSNVDSAFTEAVNYFIGLLSGFDLYFTGIKISSFRRISYVQK